MRLGGRVGRAAEPAPRLDVTVPALIVKIGRYPWHHGGVGAIRSLGRLGVPVYAVTEDRWTPAAMSRYLRDRFVWPTTGLEEPDRLVGGLLDAGRRIGRPAVLIPTDDEAAVLIAENAAELGGSFLFPDVDPALPRRLCSKRGLHELCLQHGVPTPRAAFPASRDEVEALAGKARFPLMAKNVEAFERRRSPAVTSSTRIDDAEQLRRVAAGWGEHFSVLLQEFLPIQDCEDWIFHAYCDESSDCLVGFTGVKVRSFPPQAGMTSCGYSVPNPALREMSTRFVKSVGYCGALDLDWRYDRRTGEYYLLDFNPRLGAQFRLFENSAGVDVVRALHLDLTGRAVPAAPQVDNRRYLVESCDLRAARAPSQGYRATSVSGTPTSTELAWLAPDDMRPFFVMLARLAARRFW